MSKTTSETRHDGEYFPEVAAEATVDIAYVEKDLEALEDRIKEFEEEDSGRMDVDRRLMLCLARAVLANAKAVREQEFEHEYPK